MPSEPLVTTRRAALGAVAVGLAAGCTGGGDDPAGAGSAAPSPTAPAVDADGDLVAQVRGLIRRTADVVDLAGDGAPGLRRELRPFRRLHAAHLAELAGVAGDGDDDGAGRPPTAGADPRSSALREEHRLQRRLADAAVRAESGALARLLASMSAAVAQHLAVTR